MGPALDAPAATDAPLHRAEQAVAAVQTDPRSARELALEARAAARRAGDAEAASVATRALGLVAVEEGEIRTAAAELRRAVRIADEAGLSERAAEAHMSLSLVLAFRGDGEGALRELDLAARVLRGLPAARLAMQRGITLQKLDRPDEALECYRRALSALRRHGDRLWEARLRCNRGVLYADTGALSAARGEFERAEALFREDGRDLAAAQMRHNLGWLAARAGDAPTALAWFDRSEEALRASGAALALVRLDRGALLRTLGLVRDAQREVRAAIGELEAGGMASDAAEALVVEAELALQAGDPAAAAAAARRAERVFARQDRRRWPALARLVALRARVAAGATDASTVAAAAGLAGELAAAGWAAAAIDAHVLAARAALGRGDAAAAREHLDGARRRRPRSAPVSTRTALCHAEALLRLEDGDRRGAVAAVAAGLRLLEEHRATLGATELRVHAAGHGRELAGLGVRLALDGRRARRVLRWAEASRAAALRVPPVRPPDDPRLAADLAELRRIAVAVDDALLEGASTRSLLRRQAALERAVRDRARHAAAGDGASPVTTARLDLGGLTDALGERVLVELVAHGGRLHAVDVVDGRATLREVGPAAEIDRDVDAILFGLRRLAVGHGALAARETVQQATRAAAARLDERLLPRALRASGRDLVVVPTGSLHAVPWGMLPSCAGRPVAVAPSAALWLRASALPAPADPGACLLVAGPGLDHAEAEVRRLAASYPRARVLTGAAAAVEPTLRALDGAGLAHVAAHGTFRADNPLFSALRLSDGALTVFELEGLVTPPRRLVLTACDVGRSDVAPGDELVGVVAALLSLGTATVVASVLPLADAATAELAEALHEPLRAGDSPAAALAQAAAERPAGTAGLVCFGAG